MPFFCTKKVHHCWCTLLIPSQALSLLNLLNSPLLPPLNYPLSAQWAHLGSNQGPTGYEPVALPAELWALNYLNCIEHSPRLSSCLIFDKALQAFNPTGMTKFPQCLCLNLPNPLPCDIEILPYFFQRMVMVIIFADTKPHP